MSPAPPPPATSCLACPTCSASLTRSGDAVRCDGCGASYPTVAGGIPVLIPDGRLPTYLSDPGAPFDRAVEIAERLHRTPGTYRELIDAYYEQLRDILHPDLFDYYRTTVLQREVVPVSDEVCSACLPLDVLQRPFPAITTALEIGCGWGFSLASLGRWLAERPDAGPTRLVGLDFNPAILVIARRMIEDCAVGPVEVAVADASVALPVARGSVDFLFASSVIEHLPRQDEALAGIDRALSAESAFYFSVPNRFTLHPEPHFNLRGVGFLPRRWQRAYLGWRLKMKRTTVERIMSYSAQDLADLLCPRFPRDMLATVPAFVADPNPLARRVSGLVPSLGVWSHHGVVLRTAAIEEPGVLHVGAADLQNRPRLAARRVARRNDGPHWPS